MNSHILRLSLGAIIFGSIYTIFRKYQSCAQLTQPDKTFNQPLIQSFFIFLGMAMAYIFKSVSTKKSQPQQQYNPMHKYVLIIPSVLDVGGTIVDTAGLFYTSVSVSQMLKGSVIFFTYLITIFYLKRSLSYKKHIFMVIILASLILIGSCNINKTDRKYQSDPLLGNILIIVSQFLFSLMFIAQEKLLKNYKISIIDAVSWEGIWGALISGVLVLLFSHQQTIIKCDFFQSCDLIYKNPNLLIAIFLTFVSIAPFNYFGMSITKHISALQRCLVCTFRMVIVWIVSLVIGWQQFSWVQLIGYLILTYAIYQFSQQNQQPQNSPIQQQNIQKQSILKSQSKDIRQEQREPILQCFE